MARRFSTEELSLLDRAVDLAEELTGNYFKLTRFGPPRYTYEVATDRDLEADERSRQALAKLVRYVRIKPGPNHSRSPFSFFRICLQDANILEAWARGSQDFELSHMLLYVLTHELVHIVRFERFAHLFYASDPERTKEESIVYRTTHEILRQNSDPGLCRLLAHYEASHPALFDQMTTIKN